jgi:hypothetical protein
MKFRHRNSYVHRRRPEFWPSNWILHHDYAPPHKALSVKQFLPQKSITKMEHPFCSPDLALKDFWLFPKIKSALKVQRFEDIEDIQKHDDGIESYSTTQVPKMFPRVVASLAQVHSCSRTVLQS